MCVSVCVSVCDHEALLMRPWPTSMCWAVGGSDLSRLVFAKVNERDFSCAAKLCVNFHYQILDCFRCT